MEKNNTLHELEGILGRTSIRQYTDAPVSDKEIEELMRAAMSAPTGVNKQPWEFAVVTDRKLLEQLADALPYAKMVKHAPAAIVVCGNKERFLDGDDSTLWVQDISAASENILVAAHILRLGAVWTALYPHSDRMSAVSKILNLPSEFVPFNVIPVGHPTGEPKPHDKFHPERIHRY